MQLTDLTGYQCQTFPQGIVTAHWPSVVVANAIKINIIVWQQDSS